MIFKSLESIALKESLMWGWKKIKEEVEKGKHKSYETRMYCAIVNSINKVTYNLQQRDMDRIYQAAEILGKEWSSYGTLTDEIIKKSLCNITIIDNDIVSEFSSCLYDEIYSDEKLKERYIVSTISETKNKVATVDVKIDAIGETVVDMKNNIKTLLSESTNRTDNNVDKSPRLEVYRISNKGLTEEKYGKTLIKVPVISITDIGLIISAFDGGIAVDNSRINSVDFLKITNVGIGLATNLIICFGNNYIPQNFNFSTQEGFIFAILPQVQIQRLVTDYIKINYSDANGFTKFNQEFEITLTCNDKGYEIRYQLNANKI